MSEIIVDSMEDLDMAYPPPQVDLAEIRRTYHALVKENNEMKRGGH